MNDIKPTFIKVFQMMSGFITPFSIGLTNRNQIISLIKRTRILFKIFIFINDIINPSVAFTYALSPYYLRYSIYDTLVYGILNIFIVCTWARYATSIISYHGIYFYILCYYLKLKMNNLNIYIKNISKSCKPLKISNMFRKIHSIYTEIHEYNEYFWSKYFLCFWLIMGSIVIFMLYLSHL